MAVVPAEPESHRVVTRHWRDWPALLSIFAVAFAARIGPTLAGGGLLGRGNYDDGVYFAASVALVHGKLPYDDFLFLHPPAILVALAPFAFFGVLTSDAMGFGAARLAWMTLGAVNAVLLARLLRRSNAAAAMVGGIAYALFWPAVYSEHLTLLEALANTALLTGLLLVWARPGQLGSRRAFVAGIALGVGVTVKIWGVVPALIIGLWLWRRHGWRSAVALVAGAATLAVVLCGPFLLSAPQPMWQMLISDQLSRLPMDRSPAYRLDNILGLDLYNPPASITPMLVLGLGLVALLVLAAWRSPDRRLFVFLFIGMVTSLLLTPSWFPHYSAFVAVPITALIGLAGGWLHARLASSRRVAGSVAVAGILAAIAAFSLPISQAKLGPHFPGRALQTALTRRPGCVTSDDATTLILMNVLSSNLDRGCAPILDLAGLHLAEQAATQGSPAGELAFSHTVLRYLASGSATIIARYSANLGYSNGNPAVINHWPILLSSDGYLLRQPTPQ